MKFKNWLEITDRTLYPPALSQTGEYQSFGTDVRDHRKTQRLTPASAAKTIVSQIDPQERDRNPLNPNQAMSGVSGTPSYMSPEMASRINGSQYENTKDSLEELIDSLTYLLPIKAKELSKVAETWRQFRNALYQQKESINPALYDVALLRNQSIDKYLQELEQVFKENPQHPLKKLYDQFKQTYSQVVPPVVKQIEIFRQNTPRR